MRESQYIDQYLNQPTPKTVGTFLKQTLGGKAAKYTLNYKRSLQAAIDRRVALGEVEAVKSVRGGVAYRRVNKE